MMICCVFTSNYYSSKMFVFIFRIRSCGESNPHIIKEMVIDITPIYLTNPPFFYNQEIVLWIEKMEERLWWSCVFSTPLL